VFSQLGDKFELRVDNESFMHIYNQKKAEGLFRYEGQQQEQPRDFDLLEV